MTVLFFIMLIVVWLQEHDLQFINDNDPHCDPDDEWIIDDQF